MVAEHSRTDKGVEEASKGIEALDSSLSDMASYINQELGVVILDICKDESLGSLDDRASVFQYRSDRWLNDHFPMVSGGITAKLIDMDVTLSVESMEIIEEGDDVGGYTPAYLRGLGTVTVRASSGFGGTERDLNISTDGSYALPFACEQGSLFERMTEDGGISISQIMLYQLESLAQYRVLNGFGSKSQYGPNGTESIVTADDVRSAYINAVDIVRTICFRDPEGTAVRTDLDASDLLNPEIVIDRASFYGQCLMSVVDDIALKWFDYLCGNRAIERLDNKLAIQRLALDCLIGFFTGDDPLSAEGYIVRVMEDNGVPEDTYRFPGSGTTEVSVNGLMFSVDNPVKDLFEQKWVRFFNIHYELDRCYIQNLLRGILNDAAQRLFDSDFGKVIVRPDPYDDVTFMETVSESFLGLIEGCELAIDSAVLSVLESSTYTDPFYAAIADTVMGHADSMADIDAFRGRIAEKLKELAGEEYEILMESPEVALAVHQYLSKVHSDLYTIKLLEDVEGSEPGILYDVLTDIAEFGLRASGLSDAVHQRMTVLMDEIVSNMAMNPYSGILDIPETEYFVLIDESGNSTRETINANICIDPVVSRPTVLHHKCTHVTGFREELSAAYSTTFEVRVRDCIEYRIGTNSAFGNAMGVPLTSASSGIVNNDIVLEISVASGWALAGVHYTPTDTVLSDMAGILYDLLEPIMEPLRKVMEMVMQVVDKINSCIMEIARYVSDILTDLYESIMGPLQEISDWIDGYLSEVVGDAALSMYYSLNLTEQAISFDYLGYTFSLQFNLASLMSNVKTLFIATLSGPIAGLNLEASLTAKAKGELNANNVFVTGKATVSSDDWKVKMSMDPLMRSSKHLLTVSANVRGTDITAVLPDIEDYNELGVTLSRIPGVGQMLSNIPLPMLGVNIGLDAGLSIKYSAPMEKGLLINEFESNPRGNDEGKEWVELFNNSDSSIELDGYRLVASSDRSKKTMELSGTISPGEFLVIDTAFSMVNSSGKLTKNGEGLTLKDPDGVVVDKTTTHKDESDDGRTWQRMYDGSNDWEFKESTMGRSNGSFVSNKLLSADAAKDIVWSSVQKSFDSVGSITDIESLQQVIKLTVKNSVDGMIKRVSGCLVEASVFLKVDVLDPTSTASSGIRVALRCDSELVEDVLKYIAGKIEAIALSMKNPYKVDGVSMFTDNIDLEITFDTRIQYPGILARMVEDPPKVDLGITFRTNISALTRILGKNIGTPGIECGIRIIDCPLEIIPSKLSAKRGMDHDLWLFRLNVEWD